MSGFAGHALRAVELSVGMIWQVGWSLSLGFAISALVQALVSRDGMRAALGRDGMREVALATAFGAASSSCSYASAAVSRTLFKRGAALVPSLAFLFSSTNLVIELGLVLYLLLGWQFTAAEWVGGLALIGILLVLVKLTYPRALVEAARAHPEAGGGHAHDAAPVAGATLWAQLRNAELLPRVARTFVMDVSMVWKDLLLGFAIAGVLAAFVPAGWWAAVFASGAPGWVRVPVDAALGPIVAAASFVCSIGNVPLAAVLWGSGVSFGGVLAFLYADLLVLPLIDVYRRYYGWRMTAYLVGVFYATMVLAGIVMEVVFSAGGVVPARRTGLGTGFATFGIDHTFWLDVVFGAVAVGLWRVAVRHPAPQQARHCCH